MAFIQQCGSLVRVFVSSSTPCQIIFTRQVLLNNTFRGYVKSLSTTTTKYLQKYVYSSIANEKLNNLPERTRKKQNISSTIELENYIETLSMGFINMNVHYDDLLYALKLYSTINDDNTDDQVAVFLLKCCGEVLCNVQKNQRQNLTQHFWNLFQQKIPVLTLEHYHTLLDIYAQNNDKINAPKFIESMTVKPDKNTFLYLLKIAGKTGDIDIATFSLTKMKEYDYPLDQESFRYLIETYWRRDDIDLAVTTLETIISSGFKPDEEMYANLACGYASLDMTDEVLKLIKNYSFDARQVLRIIKHLNHNNNKKETTEIFKYLPIKKIISDPILINTVVELVHTNKLQEAENIVKYFLDNEEPNKTINLVEQFLSSLVISKQSIDKILNIAKDFEQVQNQKIILLKLLEVSLRSSQRDLSIIILEKIKTNNIEIRTHYYWPLFIQASKEGEISIISTMKHMLSLNVEINNTTLVEFILPFINTSNSLTTLKKLTNIGLKLSQVRNSLVCYYLENNKINETINFIKSTKGNLNFDEINNLLIKYFQISNDVNGCLKILQFAPKYKNYAGIFLDKIYLTKTNKFDILILDKFIDSFEQHNIFISSDTVKLIKDNFSSINNKDKFNILMKLNNIENVNIKQLNSEKLSGIPHPKNMTLEQLECHLVELKSKNLNTRGILRKLLMIYCKNNNLKRVEELLNEIKKSDIIMSPAMKALLLDIYTKNDNVDKVSFFILDLQKNHSNFSIDSFKIINAATMLVKHNKIQTAFEIINNYKNALHQVPSDCWKLLDTISRSEYAEKAHDFLITLVLKNYCSINNTVLGPLVRRHLIKNDLSSAVDTFSVLAKMYSLTPLKQELVCALVESKNDNKIPELLKIVTDIVSSIHGQLAVDMELTIAYAKHGMMDELKNILKNFIHLNMLLENSIQNIPDDLKINILINILDASREFERIDRAEIYNLLLDIYCKTENHEAVIELWNIIKLEGVINSSTLEKKFTSLLLKHNIDARQ